MSQLVNGNIPAGSACPFIADCGMVQVRCPSIEFPRSCEFSCALARLNDMIAKKPNSNGLLKKVRDGLKPSE